MSAGSDRPRARVTPQMIDSMRAMRARNRTYECIARLHGCSEATARRLTVDVVVPARGAANAQIAARHTLRRRAEYMERLVARVARVMPEAVR